MENTAAGTVEDSHLIPFYTLFCSLAFKVTISGAKLINFLDLF